MPETMINRELTVLLLFVLVFGGFILCASDSRGSWTTPSQCNSIQQKGASSIHSRGQQLQPPCPSMEKIDNIACIQLQSLNE